MTGLAHLLERLGPSPTLLAAVINMIRQTGLAIGVAVLVATVPHSSRFATVGGPLCAISFVGIVPALILLRRPAAASPTATATN